MDKDEVIEVKQGSSIKRRKRKTIISPEEDIVKSQQYVIKNNKAEPYIDPNAKPKHTYKFKKIILQQNVSENDELNFILNNCGKILKWEEKILQDGSMCITVIYTEPPPKNNVLGENTNA